MRRGYDRVESSIGMSYDEIKGVTMSVSRDFDMLGKITTGLQLSVCISSVCTSLSVCVSTVCLSMYVFSSTVFPSLSVCISTVCLSMSSVSLLSVLVCLYLNCLS